MKNRFPQSILMLLIGSMCLTACDKDDDKDKEKTNTEKITLAAWKYDKASLDVNKDGTGDIPVPDSELEACERDNLITFKADNTGTIDEGPAKCDPSDPQSIGFTWTFKNNETVINFPTAIVAGVDGDVTIVSLSETSMVLKGEIDGVPPIISPTGTANIILTLKH
ncbi:lipocalin-like domain-containing protein [Flavitalea sp.]|nr:lipocalin family protein [Flavitalea sp.]